MLPFRKILFPVDFSDSCQAIVPYIKDTLRHYSMDLTLVHAFGPGAALTPGGMVPTDPDLLEGVRSQQNEHLWVFAETMFPCQHVEVIVELGEPGSVIHKIAEQQEADLVMLPTHGYGPVRRLLLGSVTAKVLHDISAAVWTGIGSVLAEHPARIPYRSIVCAVDSSGEAEAVLRAAASVAATYQADLSILHVVETPAACPEVDFGPFKKQLINAALGRLRELQGTLGIDAPHTVIDARIPDGTRHEVLRRKADLLITGRGHAQATFARVWSHLYQIVRESPCPVLSI